MSVPSPAPAPPKKGRGRWFKVRVIGAVLILVIGFALYLNWRNGLPPTQVSTLSQGQLFLDVPVMTFYSFGPMDVAGYRVDTALSFAASSSLALTWTSVAAGGESVRFVLQPGGPFQAGPAGGFTFALGGALALSGAGAMQPGLSGVLVSLWAVNYSVRQMATHNWFSDVRSIEVDYRPSLWGWSVLTLPAANTTAPTSSDLAPAGPPVRLSFDSGIAWSYNVSVHGVALPQTRFQNALPPVTFPGGSGSAVTATLVTAFSWSSGDTYMMGMGGTGAANLSFQPYVDLRFGSVLVEPVA